MAAVAAKPLSSPKHVLVTGPPGVGKTTLICRVCELLQQRHGVAVRGFYTQEVREEGGGGGRKGRGRGPRIGFDVVTLDGKRGPLARTDRLDSASSFPLAAKKSLYVGKYCVDIASFEAVALPALDLKPFSRTPAVDQTGRGVVTGGASSCEQTDGTRSCLKKVLVIDEIGKMELFSRDFVEKIKSLFEVTSRSPASGCGQEGVVLLATIPMQRPQQKSHCLLADIRRRKDCRLYEVNEKNRDQLVQEIISFILQASA